MATIAPNSGMFILLLVSGTQLVMIRQENERTLAINIAIFKDGQTEAEYRTCMSAMNIHILAFYLLPDTPAN